MRFICKKATGLIFIAVCAAGPLSVHGGEDEPKIPFQVSVSEKNGISYVEGGIGDRQQERMQEVGGSYSLQFTFADSEGKYLSGVNVAIMQDAAEVLSIKADGPLLNVNLDPGEYEITLKPADFKGETKEYSVQISTEPTVMHVTWNS